MNLQCTLDKEVSFSGIGLHSGLEVNVTFKPGPVDSGISFIRKDLPGQPELKADVYNIKATTLCTTLGYNGFHIHTVEHLLAAFRGMNVDNAIIEIDADEVPIMDGSAEPFVKFIKRAGIIAQGALRKYILIKSPVSIAEGDKLAVLLPADYFAVSFTIDFDHPVIQEQSYHVKMTPQKFMEELSTARTFGFLKDVNYMHKNGLALGGSLDNAVVLDDNDVLNNEGLRFHDEFVRHKMLDSLGDLSLIGAPVIGHFYAFKSGHHLNTKLVKLLLNNPHCWEYVTSYAPSKEEIPSAWAGLRHPWIYEKAGMLKN